MKKIAFITSGAKLSPEELAGLRFAHTIGASRLTFSTLPDPVSLLRRYRVLWWHYDTARGLPSEARTAEHLSCLRSYVEAGGSILLTLLASQYVYHLRFESTRPNFVRKGTWAEDSWAADYPDIRGMAGFREHPVFEGLHGGAYTWSPEARRPYSAALYDESSRPAGGRVIAVERQYIRLNEHRKIIVEYEPGRGRVLTIGTHFFFADRPNRFRPHLERVAKNALRYLSGDMPPRTGTYWTESSLRPRRAEFVSKPQKRIRAPHRSLESGLSIIRERATNSAFDLGGARLLILGDERQGIEEIWAHPVRIFRDLRVRLLPHKGEAVLLHELQPRVIAKPESITREFAVCGGRLHETIFSDRSSPAAAVHYRLVGIRKATIEFSGAVDLRMMWPLPSSATGPLIYGWDAGLRTLRVRNSEGSLVSLMGAREKPGAIRFTPGRSAINVQLTYALKRGSRGFTLCFSGSGNGTGDAERAYRKLVSNPQGALSRQEAHVRKVLRTRTMVTASDMAFNEAYKWALAGTNRFLTDTPGVGTSLMAGYGTTGRGWDGGQKVSGRPGYAWYFGRDSVWTALAMLDCGDHNAARSVLEFLGRYQDITGKIAHEVTTCGYAHYDAADATPLYLLLMGRYLRASGDRIFVKKEYPKLRKAVAFCASTDTDGDQLIENSGVGHGWVEGGALFPAHAELYLNSCWGSALEEAAYCAGQLGKTTEAKRWHSAAAGVNRVIQREFWNDDERSYSFSRNRDGSFNRIRTVMPAVLLYLSHIRKERATAVLDELGSEKFTTPWGTRIVGSDSPLYTASGYHYGSVWPLFTGWASLAAFRHGMPRMGFRLLQCNLSLTRKFSAGWIPEVLHGEYCAFAGVCAHQAWSESMVLQPVLEGMLGIRFDAGNRTLWVRPYLPDGWAFLHVQRIRLGSQSIDMRVQRRAEGLTCSLRLHGGRRVRVLLGSTGGREETILLRARTTVRTLLPA
jgi:glycogen debranching enzyme